MSLVLEAAEVLEHFQWKSKEEIEEYITFHKQEVGDELADVLYWILLMSNDLGIDILEASYRKLEENKKRPVTTGLSLLIGLVPLPGIEPGFPH